MTNPLVAIEQITYLLFLKQLEALDHDRVERGLRSIYGPRRNCTLKEHYEDDDKAIDLDLSPGADPGEYCKGHGTCRWSYIVQHPEPYDLLNDSVFKWLQVIDQTLIETGHSQQGYESIGSQMDDAYFLFPKDKGGALRAAISQIDRLFSTASRHSANADLMGDIFEYLLEEITTAGKNGQFRTPRHPSVSW
jgi:type I restriction enzyme M protein